MIRGRLATTGSIEALWPASSTFVADFEFDHNTMVSCFPLKPYIIKDSAIHDNEIDNSETSEWTIRNTPAFLDNVDIYNNVLLSRTDGHDDSYDPVTNPNAHNAIFSVELWQWKGGCQFYNNSSNAYFSLTCGKETKIYGNTIRPFSGKPVPSRGIGIEASSQSYLELYDNYVGNNQHAGIVVGLQNAKGPQEIVRGISVKNNVVVDSAYGGLQLSCRSTRGYNVTTRDAAIYNNVVYGPRHAYGMKLDVNVADDGGSALLENASIKNNIFMNVGGPPGKAEGTGSAPNLVIDHNLFYGNEASDWLFTGEWTSTTSVTNTLEEDPLFLGPLTSYDGFALFAASPAIDAGVDVGLPYAGAAPDIGAIESGMLPPASKRPAAPTGLVVTP